ncbi:Citrinin biosynthesis transcriptional activator ctnR [Paramyrothecium foliicola]|nr:Citrinin biosynthesis transcriptional activator ctnR [Paramyrothecium foliicola]
MSPHDIVDAQDAPGSNVDDSNGTSKKRKLSARDDNQDPDGPASCVRYNVDCVYHDNRAKTGIRTGAIESLNQRLASLEHMFLGQSILWEQLFGKAHPFNNVESHSATLPENVHKSLESSVAQLRERLSAASEATEEPVAPRVSSAQSNAANVSGSPVDHVVNGATEVRLPPDDVMDSLIETYFDQVHPWIPMLHVRQFRRRLSTPQGRESASTIFYAITSLCARFSNDARLGNGIQKAAYARQCRQVVILRSMESFSVENLQALTICAFDLIGGGRGPSAWVGTFYTFSIVGSMTRTVEQLQLSVEEEDQEKQPVRTLIRRMNFLQRCKDWSETEERRRVFWNIFIMDRFCSIATGWNFSLTSADVKRRLPCEGSLWERGQRLDVPTPYFGIADQSSRANPTVPTARPEGEDQALLGGFAFCIEATESLSLVTSFFLQHDLDFTDPRQFQLWLIRFKQLDLRLIQWKIFLPEPWREACVLNADGNMDPNLTLAHMTHNTAVILLHQVIAFPLPEWQNIRMRLPSASSAESCYAAATEVGIIAEEFLQRSPYLTNPQFAFCLFICGRLLLTYSSYKAQPLSPTFNSLVDSLTKISARWNGPFGVEASGETHNLASKFATRLTQAHQQSQHILDIREPAYSDNQYLDKMAINGSEVNGSNSFGEANAVTVAPPEYRGGVGMPTPSLSDLHGASPDSISMAFPPLPLSFQNQMTYGSFSEGMAAASPQVRTDLLGAPSSDHMLSALPSHNDLEMLFDPSFPTDQRVSVFSYSSNI